jgi:hypothetical protein
MQELPDVEAASGNSNSSGQPPPCIEKHHPPNVVKATHRSQAGNNRALW